MNILHLCCVCKCNFVAHVGSHCKECEQFAYKRTPKQATKAPSGAAVSSLPFHTADVPLDSTMTAEVLALKALDEAKNCIVIAESYRQVSRKEAARFYLLKAAEFRRVYQAFTSAIDVMGGL